MLQNALRQRLIKYLAETGIKQNFIAEKVGLPVSILSRFKTYQKSLTNTSFNKLDNFLAKQGF